MTLDELLTLVTSKNSPGLCADSRVVKQGDIFVAVRGTTSDGHDYIDQAVKNGARFIVAESSPPIENVELVIVKDTTQAAALLAQAENNYPAKKLTNLAVTGTNGKTTVAFIVRSIMEHAEKKCGLIGTVLYDTGSNIQSAPLTTPDCFSIAQYQRQMVEAGSEFMVIEASSHALDQNRLSCIDFTAAAFTNLSGDHIDYHKTEENYLAAKSLLFEELSQNATAVLNKQSPHLEKLAAGTSAKILTYAIDEPADITAHIGSMEIGGTTFELEYDGLKSLIKIDLPGLHNVSNALAAAGLCITAGLDITAIAAGLNGHMEIPGRLEKVESDRDFSVLIDYAHTDDALENVLKTLKPLCKAQLTLVFGCGGDRDKTKRPRMAKVAEQFADNIFVTSDNPRTEHPAAIIGEIATGFENPVADTIIYEADRRIAIEMAIESASTDDIILIAGKGHENYQIIGTEKIDFSDKKIALQLLNEKCSQ